MVLPQQLLERSVRLYWRHHHFGDLLPSVDRIPGFPFDCKFLFSPKSIKAAVPKADCDQISDLPKFRSLESIPVINVIAHLHLSFRAWQWMQSLYLIRPWARAFIRRSFID
jgi:hypothetical protein